MAKPERWELMPRAQVSTASQGGRRPETLPGSLRAFPLPQACPQVVWPGHLALGSLRVRAGGKRERHHEDESP